jgi:hypothetical protein
MGTWRLVRAPEASADGHKLVTVRLPLAVHEKLVKLAEEGEVSPSGLAATMLSAAVRAQPSP